MFICRHCSFRSFLIEDLFKYSIIGLLCSFYDWFVISICFTRLLLCFINKLLNLNWCGNFIFGGSRHFINSKNIENIEWIEMNEGNVRFAIDWRHNKNIFIFRHLFNHQKRILLLFIKSKWLNIINEGISHMSKMLERNSKSHIIHYNSSSCCPNKKSVWAWMSMLKYSWRSFFLSNIYFLNVKSCSRIVKTQVWIWSDIADDMRLGVFSNVIKLRDDGTWGFKFVHSIQHILLHRVLYHALINFTCSCIDFYEFFFKPYRYNMSIFQILHTIDLHSNSLVLTNCLENNSKSYLRRKVFSFVYNSNDSQKTIFAPHTYISGVISASNGGYWRLQI